MMWTLALLFSVLLNFQTTPDYYSLSEEQFFALEAVHQPVNPEALNEALLEAAVFFASNRYRTSKRKKPLRFAPTLQASARLHSKSMMEFNFFSHINTKNRSLRTPFDRIKKVGGTDFTAVGENLIEASLYKLGTRGSYHIKDGSLVDEKGDPLPLFTYSALAQDIVNRWAGSKEHRANLLDTYAFLGCGLSQVRTEKDGLKIVYVTQNFGSKN